MATDSNRPAKTTEGGSASQSAKEVAQEAGKTAKELRREAASQARSTSEYVREQARTSLDEGKGQVARQVGGLAEAFHKSSEELRSQELGRLADQSEWVAGRIEEMQNYLQERDPGDVLNDLRGVARRQPGWFLGGMFAAGLAASRFLQSGESYEKHHDSGSATGQYSSGSGTRATST